MPNDPLEELIQRVSKCFNVAFGPTTLADRIADIANQAAAVGRSHETTQLKQETGDLLTSVLQLCHECNWNPQELIDATLNRIETNAESEKKIDRRLRAANIGGSVEHRRIAVYADTFDPPSRQHRMHVEALLENNFDEVVIYPISARPEFGTHENVSSLHRAALLSLAFRDMPSVSVDYTDISLNQVSSTGEREERLASLGEVWHVIPFEMGRAPDSRSSFVRSHWNEATNRWNESRFVVLHHANEVVEPSRLPKHHLLVPVPSSPGSAELRNRIYQGESIVDFVDPDVAAYIRRHRLFVPGTPQRQSVFQIERPRLLIIHDDRNPKSIEMARQYAEYASESPNLVLVLGGDGTMLKAIREHWRLRVPFIGLNTGHLGFLMNERLPTVLQGLELVSYNLPLLRVDSKKPNGESGWGLAYTDVWLERAEGQAAWFRVEVDGETRVSKVVGDGMLVATASGSSAYARAMGAVPVPIDTPTLTLAGSNIFQPRFWKPMILSHDSRITIASLDHSGKRPVRGFIDGAPLGIVQEITVRRSLTASVELAFTKEFDPSARLLRSLFPPDEL